MIETKMDPLAASFAAMEEPAHEDVAVAEETAAEPEKAPIEKVADHMAQMKRWMDAHTVAAARPETNTPDFAEIAPPMGELYAPEASQAMSARPRPRQSHSDRTPA